MTELSESARRARENLAKKTEPPKVLTSADFLSTSITVVNLACSGMVMGGLQKGGIYRLIGKSQTSKTFVGGNLLCEAAISPHFRDYRLIYDAPEYGMKMDIAKFWRPLLGKLLPPRVIKGTKTPVYCQTLTEMVDQMLDDLDKGRKFVRVEDSLDALRMAETTKMTDNRAKALSEKLPRLMPGLVATGSIVIFVQHAKVNLGNTWQELVTTGGASPEYYSNLDIWLSKREQIKVEYRAKKGTAVEVADDDEGPETHKLTTGVMFDAHIRKNRTNGVDRSVKFPLYYDYGIDDRAACVYFLLQYGHWQKIKGIITAPEFKFEGNLRALIQHIEDKQLLAELRVLTGRVWKEIESAISQNPKPRYS